MLGVNGDDMARIYSTEELATQIKNLSEKVMALELRIITLEKVIVALRFSITKESRQVDKSVI